jgi:cytochrome c-type biogenesis protein CcmH/NrfG
MTLGLALLANDRDADALDAYRRAGERFSEKIENLGLFALNEAKKKWLSA